MLEDWSSFFGGVAFEQQKATFIARIKEQFSNKMDRVLRNAEKTVDTYIDSAAEAADHELSKDLKVLNRIHKEACTHAALGEREVENERMELEEVSREVEKLAKKAREFYDTFQSTPDNKGKGQTI